MMIQNLKTMNTQRQNKRGDFVFHIIFRNREGVATEPPAFLEIRLMTEESAGAFAAEYREGGPCTRCRKATDGIDVFVSLSRAPIGGGRMLLETVSHIEDPNFEGGEKRIVSRIYTPVFLWDGPSDGDTVISGTIIL